MISFREQVILIIYFLIFGMFLGAMFDILHYFLRKFKVKLIYSYIIELIFWIGMVIISCLYMLKISEGYLTIYTFGFFFIGVVIYLYLLRDDFKKNINSFVIFIGRVYNKYKKIIIYLIYPKEVFIVIRKIIRRLKKLKFVYKKFISKIKARFKRKKKDGEKNEEITNNYSSDIFSDNNQWL